MGGSRLLGRFNRREGWLLSVGQLSERCVNLEAVEERPWSEMVGDGLGDRIERFVGEEYGRVVRAVAVVCGDVGRAEDCVQEALLAAWTGTTEIENLGSWVVTVALNRARSGLRRLNVERVAFGKVGRARVASEDTYGPAVEGQPRVIAALAALPRRQREVAVLHYYLDLSVADVARSLQVSEGTVKTCLHRARASLRVRLTEERADGEEVGHGRS